MLYVVDRIGPPTALSSKESICWARGPGGTFICWWVQVQADHRCWVWIRRPVLAFVDKDSESEI